MSSKPYKIKVEQEKLPLTQREIEIVRFICAEYSAIEIGEILDISDRTIDAHRYNIMKKIEAKSTAGIVKYAIKNGIVVLE
jgi:DNA-binding CsgD family transcriptional regulator